MKLAMWAGWRLTLWIFEAFVWILLNVNILKTNSPDILALSETDLDESIDFSNSSEGLSAFNLKAFYYSCTWSSSLWDRLICRKLFGFLLVFLTDFTQCLLLFQLITFYVFMHGFWFYFNNINGVISIEPSADFEYTRVLNMRGLNRILNMPE